MVSSEYAIDGKIVRNDPGDMGILNPWRCGARRQSAILLVAFALILTGCRGENRPNVEVIGGADTASVSDIDVPPEGGSPAAKPPGGGTGTVSIGYVPEANVDLYFAMSLDRRDMRTALTLSQGPPDWARALAIYEQGKNAIRPNGTPRPLAGLPNDAVHAVFPDGPAVYGRQKMIDGVIRDGLHGTGRAAGLSDDARRRIVDKGILMLFYATALQEFTASQARLEANAANPTVPLDETFAILAGAPEGNARPYGLFAVASDREKDFKLDGKLFAPLEAALVAARTAARTNDRVAFRTAYAQGKGHINAIFYLSTLQSVRAAERDTTPAARQATLTEGWAYWQTIRAATASGSRQAASEIEAALSRDPTAPWVAADSARVYASLNEPAVLAALGIPPSLQIKSSTNP